MIGPNFSKKILPSCWLLVTLNVTAYKADGIQYLVLRNFLCASGYKNSLLAEHLMVDLNLFM